MKVLTCKIVRPGIAALAVIPLAFISSVASMPAAQAEERTYCGAVVGDVSPGEDPAAAFQDESDVFYDGLIEAIFGDSDVNPETVCIPAHLLVEKGAKYVVGRVVPNGKVFKVLLKASRAEELLRSGENAVDGAQGAPEEFPRVGHAVSGTVSWTNGLGLLLRSGSGSDAAAIDLVPEGATLEIQCQEHGITITSGQPTDLWDKVVYRGISGFVSDAYVYTGTYEQVAPSC